MTGSKKVVVTGAAGFIGSNLAQKLNQSGYNDLILVDKFGEAAKDENLEGVRFSEKIERSEFVDWLSKHSDEVGFIFHIGARTDTTEFDFSVLEELNLNYTKALWEICANKQIPFVYASSAATYGLGENGFSDAHELLKQLKPLNPYGESKHRFDIFALEQKNTPPLWAGLKFFNVYGPHEAHKGRMASVVYHAYHQIKSTGKVKLFKSHNPQYKDGEQLRDFIFVDDVTDVCLFFMNKQPSPPSAIYNAGTGAARTFNDLVKPIFITLNLPVQIEYIPVPEDIRDKYQYFTEAKMDKLRGVGFTENFKPVEEGVKNYVRYLEEQ